MLKASKADKEALEDGDINSILFASAGSGGGGSGGGAGPSKSSSSGVDSGGNCGVTFKSKARLKSVLKLDVETSTSVWEVINFISNFEIKMRSHKVSKGGPKDCGIYFEKKKKEKFLCPNNYQTANEVNKS